jgi:hypothetical protein
VDSRENIEYEANRRGLTVGDEWTTLPKDDILIYHPGLLSSEI